MSMPEVTGEIDQDLRGIPPSDTLELRHEANEWLHETRMLMRERNQSFEKGLASFARRWNDLVTPDAERTERRRGKKDPMSAVVDLLPDFDAAIAKAKELRGDESSESRKDPFITYVVSRLISAKSSTEFNSRFSHLSKRGTMAVLKKEGKAVLAGQQKLL